MSLRGRLALVTAVAVAATVVIVATISYFSVEDRLRGELDETLGDQAERLSGRNPERFLGVTRNDGESPFETAGAYSQVVRADGSTTSLPRLDRPLPVDDRELARATPGRGEVFRDIDYDGVRLRMVTVNAGDGIALQMTRPLTEINQTLVGLRVRLILVALGGVGVALALGLAIARTTLKPVQRLTKAAEHVAETQDLGASIEEQRSDELGRLADSFNEMLAALEKSRTQQRQLVADASHELRTPLTSLRTNMEVLAGQHDMSGEERGRLLGDLTAQLEELSVLVADLVELARDEIPPVRHEMVDLHLDELVGDAVERAQTHAPSVRFETALEPALVHGNPGMLERAFANLLNNASKWSPPDAPVEVRCSAGEVTVRDHGPGIAAEDLPRVFDRFYRGPAARSSPGSGLGLAIVRRVADAHGGSVSAEAAPGGGTLLRFRIPVLLRAAAEAATPDPVGPATTSS
jgi:two-component system sensor histidine kinase MprB